MFGITEIILAIAFLSIVCTAAGFAAKNLALSIFGCALMLVAGLAFFSGLPTYAGEVTTRNNTVNNYTFWECNNCTDDEIEYYAYPSYNQSEDWWGSYEWIPSGRLNGTSYCCKNVTTPVIVSTTENNTVTFSTYRDAITNAVALLFAVFGAIGALIAITTLRKEQ